MTLSTNNNDRNEGAMPRCRDPRQQPEQAQVLQGRNNVGMFEKRKKVNGAREKSVTEVREYDRASTEDTLGHSKKFVLFYRMSF